MASESAHVGFLAGRYRLGRRLGVGGMAQVYLARDESLDRDVAVKLLAHHQSSDTRAVERFEREVAAAASLSHPNVIRTLDSGVDENGTPFLVMEYVPGPTLKELVRADGPLPEERALELAAEVADGLAAAHHKGIVHRDVKPQNILLDGGGHARLADFGIARLIDATATHTTHVLGSAQYLSPEQVSGAVAEPRSDLYSLGVVLYELLTGVPPFHGESLEAVALQHVRAAPPSPRSIRPGLSQVAEAIVLRALEKDLPRRFSSAEQMAAALRSTHHVGEVTEPLAVEPRSVAKAPIMRRVLEAPRRRRLNPMVTIIPLALALGAIGLAAFGLPGATSARAVPPLAGQPIEAARAAAASAAFTLEVTETATLDTPRGVVVAQDPPGGTSVRDTMIRAVVSTGVEVPSLIDQSCATAHAEAAQRGWSVRPVRWRFANVEDFGKIVAQDPGAGSVVAEKSEIAVQVAGPVAPCPVGQTTATSAPANRANPPPAPPPGRSADAQTNAGSGEQGEDDNRREKQDKDKKQDKEDH